LVSKAEVCGARVTIVTSVVVGLVDNVGWFFDAVVHGAIDVVLGDGAFSCDALTDGLVTELGAIADEAIVASQRSAFALPKRTDIVDGTQVAVIANDI